MALIRQLRIPSLVISQRCRSIKPQLTGRMALPLSRPLRMTRLIPQRFMSVPSKYQLTGSMALSRPLRITCLVPRRFMSAQIKPRLTGSMALSRHEADTFLENVLKISPASVCHGTERLSFLNLIIDKFQHTIPYQSVTSCAIPHEKRHLPTWPEIKESSFKGIGGICYSLHVFMKELLSALGYNMIFVPCSMPDPGDHVAIIALDVIEQGSKHIVEVGCGHPTFQAIPLDFESESPEYLSDFLLHKFVKKDGVVLWLHERKPVDCFKETVPKSLISNKWHKFAEYQVNRPCNVDFFTPSMTEWYTDETNNKVLAAPRIVGFRNGKLLAIVANRLIAANEKREHLKTRIENKERLLALYKMHYPMIEESYIEEAIKLSPFTI